MIHTTVVQHVIDQHAEEAAFQWLMRDSAVGEPHYDLSDLSTLDERVDAHLDGLRIAGDDGWNICREALSWDEAGELFAASWLAFESNDVERIRLVIETAQQFPECARGLVSALGWLPYDQVKERITQLTASSEADLCRLGIAASAIHRRDPGPSLELAIRSDDRHLRARALRAAGELGRVDLQVKLRGSIEDNDNRCRFWSLWSLALLGERNAAEGLRALALDDFAHATNALDLALRTIPLDAANASRVELATQSGHHDLAVRAAGTIGDPAAIPWLIEQMDTEEVARLAGESFSMITGVDLAFHDLDRDAPEGHDAGPTDDIGDEDVAVDPDLDLPWPDSRLLREWWSTHGSEFQKGTRYLLGQPISEQCLNEVLHNGRQRQRAAAAIELAVRNPSTPMFEVRAHGFHQRRVLGA